MEKKEVLQYIAPCSLCCFTCPAMKEGAIAQCARKLCTLFEGYYDFNDANIAKENRSWLSDFADFYKKLEQYTQPGCPGCRNNPTPGKGCIEGCIIPSCVKEHGVDVCAECIEFPCKKAKEFFQGINQVIGYDWEKGNKRIQEIGIQAYFEEKKEVSHYVSYKKSR
ncbi:DUF3795 domain-containing protein [Anaerosporobacter faecicola]|uniref:DUF3795 domain-containing protein n=1 Tax=Anaerosporobacter faecicola TaxID=2718714 RepID=UPI00143A360B|nr:DUF3795 domain-containing protein [Anaerosporobacter faecicola]